MFEFYWCLVRMNKWIKKKNFKSSISLNLKVKCPITSAKNLTKKSFFSSLVPYKFTKKNPIFVFIKFKFSFKFKSVSVYEDTNQFCKISRSPSFFIKPKSNSVSFNPIVKHNYPIILNEC